MELDREGLVDIGMGLITGKIDVEDIKQSVIDLYLELRKELSAEELEAELLNLIAEVFSLLAVREATIGAMAEVIDELE